MDSGPGLLSETLRDVIIRRDLSAYAVAKMTGVSALVIQRFISGERGITLETADKIAMHLGLSLRENGDGASGGAEPGCDPGQTTRLVFSRKIGDAIVIDDDLILAVESIANDLVRWTVRSWRAPEKAPVAYESKVGQMLKLDKETSFHVTYLGKMSIRFVVEFPRASAVKRYETFRAEQELQPPLPGIDEVKVRRRRRSS